MQTDGLSFFLLRNMGTPSLLIGH